MIKNIYVILVLLLVFGIIKVDMKEQFNMIYFIPFLVLVLIFINTNKYEHFLCSMEKGYLLIKKDGKLKKGLLKINKGVERVLNTFL